MTCRSGKLSGLEEPLNWMILKKCLNGAQCRIIPREIKNADYHYVSKVEVFFTANQQLNVLPLQKCPTQGLPVQVWNW